MPGVLNVMTTLYHPTHGADANRTLGRKIAQERVTEPASVSSNLVTPRDPLTPCKRLSASSHLGGGCGSKLKAENVKLHGLSLQVM